MYGPRVALWCAAILSFGWFSAGLWTGDMSNTPSNKYVLFVLFVVVALGPASAEVYAQRRKRREWYASNFSSIDDLRASLDLDELRRLRAEKGEWMTVLAVRARYRLLPKDVARQLVREL